MSKYFFMVPGFLRGAARVLDLGATLQEASYLTSESPSEVDARAVASDWAAVEKDFAVAAFQLVNEQEA